MPGIDFCAVRARISIAQVLELIRFDTRKAGAQLRGACPVHGSADNSRVFSANLAKNAALVRSGTATAGMPQPSTPTTMLSDGTSSIAAHPSRIARCAGLPGGK